MFLLALSKHRLEMDDRHLVVEFHRLGVNQVSFVIVPPRSFQEESLKKEKWFGFKISAKFTEMYAPSLGA